MYFCLFHYVFVFFIFSESPLFDNDSDEEMEAEICGNPAKVNKCFLSLIFRVVKVA